jgi:hypothetical protein
MLLGIDKIMFYQTCLSYLELYTHAYTHGTSASLLVLLKLQDVSFFYVLIL